MSTAQHVLLIGVTGLHITAIVQLLRHHLPEPFPWKWSLLFAWVLALGVLRPLGTPAGAFAFLALLSAVVVGAHVQLHRPLRWLAIGLAAFILADALRFIPTPDQALAGEVFLGGIIRRPYVLSHPNSVVGWALLLPFGPWTPIAVLATQSRGALIGLAVALIAGYVPRRVAVWAALAGAVVFAGAALLRPGTMLVRLDYWREGLQLFVARPLAGWGSGSYGASLHSDGAEASQMLVAAGGERTGMPHAHNALVTIAAEDGLLGLIVFGAMAAGVFSLVRRSTHPARWGLLAFWVQQLVDDQWLHPVTAVLLGLALAACLFERARETNKKGGCHGKKKPQGPPVYQR